MKKAFLRIHMWFEKNRKKMLYVNLGLIFALGIYAMIVAKPEKVEGLQILKTTYSATELSWNESDDAKSYRVYRSTDGLNYDLIDTTTDTSYTDRKLRTGTTYYYAITARNLFKTSELDTEEAVDTTPSLEKPELKIDVSDGELKLSYSKVDGALGYEISKDGEVIDQSASTSYVDEGADGEEHDYTVRAYRYVKDPVYSEESNKVAVEMELIEGFAIELFEGDMYVSWTKSDFYKNYKVYNGGTVVAETSDTKCLIKDYKKDTEYDLRVVGYNDDGTVQSPDAGRDFEIIEETMTNAQAIEDAVQWGIHVANDNSFTYGAGRRAHRYGCYFCQTNVGPRKNIKGKSKVNGHSYEKTYCCNPFAHALYAHGTGDPAMMKACRSGHGIAMTKKSFTRYGHWKYCGKVSKSNLKRGDVLVRSNHVMTYIGNGKIVQASGGGWDAGSIQVTELGSKKYTFVMRYTGTGRGWHDVVRDLDDNGNLLDEDGNIIRKAEDKKEDSNNEATEEKAAAENDKTEETGKAEEAETGEDAAAGNNTKSGSDAGEKQ